MKYPELLVPAGTFEKMKYGFAYGADAVYAGVPRFSLRARENDFTEERLKPAVQYARNLGKKIYLTMNIFPHNRKVDSFIEMLDTVAAVKADGLIMADPGMIMIAREKYPEIDIHLSTQANTINWQTVRVPDIELETFIHGAICIAYSGRCLLSNYFTHRDANQGACTNACRWEYNIYSEPNNLQTKKDAYRPVKGSYYIEETERPDSLMPIEEDEHGTYIMNAKDLSTIHILNDLIAAGIDSLKMEGRTKSIYYLSVITRAYREALNNLKSTGKISKKILNEVYAVANRGYVSGFLERNPKQDGQNYLQSHSDYQTRIFAGIVDSWDNSTKMATVRVRNRFELNDSLELISPRGTTPFRATLMTDLDDVEITAAPGGGKDISGCPTTRVNML